MKFSGTVAGATVAALVLLATTIPLSSSAHADGDTNDCPSAMQMVDEYHQTLVSEINARTFNFSQDVGKYFDQRYTEVVDGVYGETPELSAFLTGVANAVASSPGSMMGNVNRTTLSCRTLKSGVVISTGTFPVTLTSNGQSNTTRLIVSLSILKVGSDWKIQQTHRETLPGS